MQRRYFVCKTAMCLTLAGLCTIGSGAAHAQDTNFPTKPINITVTFPPGGGTDMLARLIGNHFTEVLGQPAVIENRPGASGNIGARAVAQRPADGYSLLMVNSSFAVNPAVFSKLPFDPKKDFDAVINFAYVPLVLVTPPDSPYKTLADVVKAAKPKDNPVAYGSCGNGTPPHLAGEMFNISAKTHMQHVPFKGCGPLLNDLMGGQVGLGISAASAAIPLIKDGRLRALAVTSAQRSALLPNVPTIAEQGYPGYELNQWHGLLAPSGTPDAIKNKLYEAAAKIVARDDIKERLASLGYSAANEGPGVFQKIIHNDIDRFAAAGKQVGLKID